jgi:hypothetical protein
MKRYALAIAAIASLLGPVSGTAQADQIIGAWCPPGQSLSLIVRNYDDVVFAGQAVKANVARHHIDFAVPEGNDAAGERFSANQLNDNEIRVTIGSKPAEIWTPCKPIS